MVKRKPTADVQKDETPRKPKRVAKPSGVMEWFAKSFRCSLPCEDAYYGAFVKLKEYASQQEVELKRAVYPGSFIHIVPSLVVPHVVYIDNFKGQNGVQQKFFSNPQELQEKLLSQGRLYDALPEIRYLDADYVQDKVLVGEEASFDLLVSLNASGEISKTMSSFVRPGGFLFTNDSFGDACLAFSQQDTWQFVGAMGTENCSHGGELKLQVEPEGLAEFFVCKRSKERILPEQARLNAGKGFSKRPHRLTVNAFVYIFRKL